MKFLDDVHQFENDMRDIVQFVEFENFRNDRQALTRATLDKIPDQVCEFFVKKGIMPLPPPVSGSKSDLFEEEYNPEEDVELAMTIGEDGGINLVDTNQATWNAQAYGSASHFLSNSIYSASGSISSSNNSGYGSSSINTRSLSPGRDPPNLSPYV
jgi:hypothetical protein